MLTERTTVAARRPPSHDVELEARAFAALEDLSGLMERAGIRRTLVRIRGAGWLRVEIDRAGDAGDVALEH